MVEAVFVVLVTGEDEVQDADGIDTVQVEVPVRANLALLDDRES